MANDTIAAIATAPGKSGVAVVRVSGPDAFALAEKLTRKPVLPGRISYRKIFRSSTSTLDFDFCLDDVILLSFAGPHSYTGEDVVEFQCHGGSVTPRRILEACFEAGARLAHRGEFTERAFLNGKMDLSEAESVIDLIDAKTDAAADDALAHLGGERKRRYCELYDQAVALSSELEHSLDVDESDLSEEFVSHLNSSLFTLHSSLQKAIEQEKRSALLKDGALVVLAGPPNAGKSSLLNALLGESRAIVSDVPGTTRDSIEAWIDLGGIPVRLVDTAGLRGTSDAVESEGVRRAEELIAKADIVLMLGDMEVSRFQEKTVCIHSKCDLDLSSSPSNLLTSQLSNFPTTQLLNHPTALRVSAKTGEGLDELRRILIARLAELEPRQNCRGLDLLTSACKELESLHHSTLHTPNSTLLPDPVLAANVVRSVSETLGKLIGATYSEDLLDALFSRFCVGK